MMNWTVLIIYFAYCLSALGFYRMAMNSKSPYRYRWSPYALSVLWPIVVVSVVVVTGVIELVKGLKR